MQLTIRAFLVATTLLQPVVAWAGTPDEAGAKKIEAAAKVYGPKSLSKPGLLRVGPDGDGYRLALDMVKLIADAVAPMTVKEASPLAFKLIEQADGKWSYDASAPFKLTTEYLAADKSANLAVTTETGLIKGLFDPAILLPRQAEIGFTKGVASLRDSRDALKIGVEDANVSSVVQDLSDGRGDIEGSFTINDLTAIHGIFPQPEVKISAERIDGSYKAGKADLVGIAALIRFWKVTAEGKSVETLTDAERKEFTDLVAKHTPVIDEVGGRAVATNLATTEGGKGFKLEKLEYVSRWEGLGGRAALVIGTHITNLGIDPGIWPKGLEAILPKEAALNVRASGFDMGAMWKEAAELRTNSEMTQLPRDHFSKLLLPDGKVTIDVTDSFVRSSFYDLTLSGRITTAIGTRQPPVGSFVVSAKDFDGTIKYLQDNTKTVPIFGRFAMMAAMAKGFGKSGPDGMTVWEIKAEEGGKLTVNGQPLPMQR